MHENDETRERERYCRKTIYQEKERIAKKKNLVGEKKTAKKKKLLNRRAKKNSTLKMIHSKI